MKKAIEGLKAKKLAKKIAGVTLGAFALGMVSAPGVLAADELSGGQTKIILTQPAYVGDAPKHAVVVGEAGGNASLSEVKSVFGMHDISAPLLTASVVADGLDLNMQGVQIYGGVGFADNAVGQGNKVILINGTYKNLTDVAAFVSIANNNVSAISNTIRLDGASVSLGVGGVLLIDATGTAKAEKNTVILNKTEVMPDKPGEISFVNAVKLIALKDVTASQNMLEMTDSKTQDAVSTHIVSDGNAKAEKSAATIKNAEIAALSAATVIGVKSATVKETTLNIIDSKVEAASGVILGSDGEASAENTVVNIKNSDFLGIAGVTGGDANNSVQAELTAKQTTLNIAGGNIVAAEGVLLASLNEAKAEKTVVNIKNAEITKHAAGASLIGAKGAAATDTEVTFTDVVADNASLLGVAAFAESGNLSAKNSTLVLNGVKANNTNVTGVLFQQIDDGEKENTGAKVILTGKASSIDGNLRGSSLERFDIATDKWHDITDAKVVADSTLIVDRVTGNSAKNISYFKNIEFKLSQEIEKDNVVMTITGDDDTDLSGAAIKTTVESGAKLNKGDRVYLLHKTGSGELKFDDAVLKEKVIFVENPFEADLGVYKRGSETGNKDLLVEVAEIGQDTEETFDNKKSIAETLAASMANINSGADFLTDKAFGEAKLAAKDGAKESAMMPFAAFGGRSMKYKSGSHIDAKGWNAALGFAKECKGLTYGIAVEHGQANYDSYVNAVHGEGKNKYTGGVIFAELKQKSGTHFDASFRAGRAKSDYNAVLSLVGVPYATNYDTSATYLGFAVGAGKEMKVSNSGSLDLYARYYFNHLNGSNTTTNNGDDLEFAKSDSSRLRLGTRYTQKMDEKNKLYAGLAWQYEFAGKAKAVVNGVDAPSPSLKGHSGMAELGWKAEAGKNLTIDLGVNGWLGKQRGIAGNVGFKWTF